MTERPEFLHANKEAAEEVAKRLVTALEREPRCLKRYGIVWPRHLVDAHAKHMTRKWFAWQLKATDRQRAVLDLIRRYND